MLSKLTDAGTISTIIRFRYALAALLCSAIVAVAVMVIPTTRGANPSSGSVSESNPLVNWAGQIKAPTGDSNCGTANNAGCDNFVVNFQPPSSGYGPYLLEIKLMPQGDWDMQIYGPSGGLLDGSGNSPGVLEIVTLINPPAGSYTVAAAPFAPVVGTDGNSYAASAELKHYVVNTAAQGLDTNINYHNFAATGSLGSAAGEPSIGVNWKTGRAMFIALEQTLRVTFDDSTIPARATWEDKSFLLTNQITMDPILFTDRTTGRTIVSQLVTPAAANSLAVLTDGCSLSAYTDDDGDTWVPDEGCGPPSGADHQSIGGGPFADPFLREMPAPAYAHAVYYCAQSGVTAYCSRSDNGGLSYGPGVPIYTSECSGLHGHPMVAPDGTVYIPNRSCGGKQGVVVSEDNGLTWSVRTVPDSIQGAMDPGVNIGAGGTVYFGYQNADGRANVAVSHDKGFTWTASKDIGGPFGIKNSAFPRVLAGDDDRAAFAFLGTPTAGPFQEASFAGEWHLYIAHTFNSGQTWTTVDATPSDPVQRGCIWMQGGSNPCRNLLDFMGSAVDKEGRVLIGYADGCINCSSPSGSHASKATIARQVNGRRLFAAYDPSGSPSPTPTATPTPTPPTQSACAVPGISLITDPPGDTGLGSVPTVPGTPAQDITEVLVAEPNQTDGVSRLAFTMRVADLTALPTNGMWRMFFTIGATTYFVGAFNDPVAGGMQYNYGTSGTVTTTLGAADSGSVDVANKTITIFVANSKIGSPVAGNTLTAIYGRTQTLVGAGVAGGATPSHDLAPNTAPTSGMPDYTLAGNLPCNAPTPTPTPNASPTPTPVVSPTPTPTPTPGGSENSCFVPGVTVVTDASGDQLPPGSSKNDIQKISIAEPNQGAGESQIVFTMKVADLSGAMPANSQWKTYFTGPDALNYWVALKTDGSGVVSYSYGTAANNLDTTIGFPESGAYSPDGTITIGIANSKVGGPTAGQTLTAVNGVAYALVGVVLNDLDDTSSGSYTLRGSASCGGGGTPTPTPTPAGSPTPTPTPIPNAPQYFNYYPPQGVAESFGEPSIGANWQTGKVMFFGGFSPYALRVSFNDSTSPATVTWDQTGLLVAATPRVAGDPILFTDRDTGRTFVSQLFGLTPFNGMDYTDDDGTTYLPSQGSGIGAGLDHQTVGGGPFHAPIPTGARYPHSVYYCAQEGLNSSGTGIANCALSVDGGLTFGPSIPIYALSYNSCFPLHGHIKIGPDGTAYLPNRGCSGQAGMVVSEDNGITWTARTIPNSSVGSSDPSIGIATDGTVFLGYQAADGHPGIAVSHDKGLTWINHTDVGAQVGVKSGIFPAVVAGDGGMDTARAAFAFYGSATAGDQDSPSFRGEWYLYISSTFDGGKTWTTVNATPGDPMQRDGICTRGFQGCTVPRNLLDFFDATVDKEGRVLVGYEDGCIGGCVQGGANSNTEKGVIARQSGGKRMFAAYDPNPNPTPTPTATPTPTPTPTATPTPTPTPTPAGVQPAPVDSGPKIGYQNFEAPGTLINVTSTSQGPGAKTVEYLGHDAGEPSIGNNWKTGVTAYQSDLQTLFVNFNDNCPANGQVATWVNRPAPTSQFIDSDPIGFTDRYTGRTFAGQLTLASGDNKTSYTDDDGQTWTVSAFGQGIGSSIDHQTIGGGPFHAPLTRPTNVPGLYPDAVYYCSQAPQSACARSDNGGATFGPIVPVDAAGDAHCGGLHGHVKVAPDGTVYLPFSYCDGQGSVIVSEDNGITWRISHIPNTVSSNGSDSNIQDPAVGIDNNGRVYFVMASGTDKNTTKAIVATSDDRGQTWQNIYDVGAIYGLKNIAYPAAVAADKDRAAVAFYGTTSEGDESANSFRGVWHLYIAHTFDGGQHWTTTDATPNAPIQRGCIWMHGGVNICRNLLDFFDMTVDREGRVEVGYVNGCAGGNCAQAAASANGNAYTALAVIARQSSGRRLIAANDPPNALTATSAPGMPSVTTRRVGNVVNIGWSLADTGNSPISNYQIMRGTASGAETLLATVPGSQTRYDDTAATDTTRTYYYKVLAVNGVGTSCAANEVAAPYIGDTCGGVILQRNDPTHPEAPAGLNTPAALLIDSIAAGEPPGTNNLMFRMKVSSLASIPANSRWRIVWNSYSSPGQQWFVGMTTGATGAPTFDYGTVATGSIPPVIGLVGVPQETKQGAALAQSNFNADGTITIYVPKSVVGNPQPGDLLGAVNGRTFTGDTPGTVNLQRSTLLIDHTFVKAQRDNGSPAATYMVVGNIDCSAFIEQNVNSLVSLQASNPGSGSGLSSFNLTVKNTSDQTIFTPLRVEVAQLTSPSGKVKVNNADNSGLGAGANWDYSNTVGIDNILSAAEVSAARTLKFNNPSNEAFTVTFNVIGNLARVAGGGSSTNGSSGGGGTGGGGSSSASSPTGTLTNMVFSVTYNPLLNTLKWQLIKQ